MSVFILLFLEVFLPSPDDLLVNLNESKEVKLGCIIMLQPLSLGVIIFVFHEMSM